MAKEDAVEIEEESKDAGAEQKAGEKEWVLINIKVTPDELEELKRRAKLNCRAFTGEATYIVKLVLGGRGQAVTVPGVDELRLTFGKEG